jgi:hypothetical protein
MITNVGCEYAHRDNVVDRSAGSFDGPFDLLDDVARLSANVADPDDVTLRIRGRLTGDKDHTARLSNVY